MAAAPPSSSTQPVGRLRSPPRAQAAPRQYGTSQPASHIDPAEPGRPAQAEPDQVDVQDDGERPQRMQPGDQRGRRRQRGEDQQEPERGQRQLDQRAYGLQAGARRRAARPPPRSTPPARRRPAGTAGPSGRRATARTCRPGHGRRHNSSPPPGRPPGRTPPGSGKPRRPGRAAACGGSGLATCTAPLSATRAVTSQWPSTTPRMASARRASTPRSRSGGVAESIRRTRSRMAALLGRGLPGDDPGEVPQGYGAGPR